MRRGALPIPGEILPPVGHEMEGLSEAERLAIVQGRGLPKPRPRLVRPTGPSIFPNRRGLSVTATVLFDAAQKAGGTLMLAGYSRRLDMKTKLRFVEELVHFGLAVVGPGPSLVIADGYEHAIVASSWDDRP